MSALLAARAALSAVPSWVWGLALGLALLAGVWFHGRDSGADAVQADWDAQEAAYAIAAAKSAEDARKLEERHRAEYRAIADRFLKEQADAKLETDRVIAGLRAGAIRVRQRLTCPRLPGASADSSGAAEASSGGLSREDAEFLLRSAADADAVARQLNALIEAVKAR